MRMQIIREKNTAFHHQTKPRQQWKQKYKTKKRTLLINQKVQLQINHYQLIKLKILQIELVEI